MSSRPLFPKRLQILTKTDIADCERLLLTLERDKVAAALSLATDWKLDSRPGGVASAVQTLITWARSQPDPILLVHSQENDRDVALDRLCRRFHGIVGAMMAGRILEVAGGADVARGVYDRIRRQVVAMDKLNFTGWTRNHAFPLFCIDHSSMAYLRPFYHASADHEVRDVADFVDLINELIPKVSSLGPDRVPAIAEDLGIVLHELFSNTHVHARTDAENRVYRRSVRGVTLTERLVWKNRLDDAASNSPDLRTYLETVARYASSEASFKLLELCVFDSGPGLAANIAGRSLENVSIEAEAELVGKCFLRNTSSQSRPGFGMGLPRVMNALKGCGGFIRLRTGRLSQSRGFDPGDDARNDPVSEQESTLLDSETRGTVATPRARAEGTAVTVLVPCGLRLP